MNLFVLRTWLEARFTATERGASMVEYILLVALIALAVIAAVWFLGEDHDRQVQHRGQPDQQRWLVVIERFHGGVDRGVARGGAAPPSRPGQAGAGQRPGRPSMLDGVAFGPVVGEAVVALRRERW